MILLYWNGVSCKFGVYHTKCKTVRIYCAPIHAHTNLTKNVIDFYKVEIYPKFTYKTVKSGHIKIGLARFASHGMSTWFITDYTIYLNRSLWSLALAVLVRQDPHLFAIRLGRSLRPDVKVLTAFQKSDRGNALPSDIVLHIIRLCISPITQPGRGGMPESPCEIDGDCCYGPENNELRTITIY